MNPWDEWASTFDGARAAVHDLSDWDNETARHVKLIREHLVDDSEGTLLDVGCGIGRLSIPLALETQRPVLGFDTSAAMLHHARAQAQLAGKDATGILGFTDSLPFGSEVGGAYSMLVLQHLPDDKARRLLMQVSRVLPAGGPLLVQFAVGLGRGEFTYERTPNEVTDLVERCGFAEADRWPDPVIPTWGWWKAYRR